MLRWSTIALALMLSAPTLWQALVDQTVPVDTAVLRFLLAVPIAAILLGLVRAAAGSGSRDT
jgi:K+-sensing histidine kinase KdpD